MLITVSKLDDTASAIDLDTAISVVYCVVSVTLNNPFAFLIKLGVEPVPLFTISKTISNDDVVLPINEVDIDAVVKVCIELVRLTEPLALACKVGNEPVPFSIISNTTSNPLPTFIFS